MFGEMVQIMPPTSGSEQAVAGWLAAMRTWRTGCQAQLGYVGGAVGPSRLPGMAWTQTSYIQPQVHTYDRLLWDPETRSYTVGRFLRDFRDRYGGIDSVLVMTGTTSREMLAALAPESPMYPTHVMEQFGLLAGAAGVAIPDAAAAAAGK